MKIFLATLIILVSTSATDGLEAQWRKIADFQYFDGNIHTGEYITCVYFLPLSDPPTLGYVGTYFGLWKTTDKGKYWANVWDSGGNYGYVTDIFFKDSMTGWFTIFNQSGNSGIACYRTLDGGNHWSVLPVPNVVYGANGVYYNTSKNLLILTSPDTGVRISSDLGDSWSILPTFQSGGISFSNDSMGIAASYPPFGDTSHGILRTTNGGLNWNAVEVHAFCEQPLAIPGTPICFEADIGRIIVRRSDDCGQTWRQVVDFGPTYDTTTFQQLSPEGGGNICGDLSRLSIQTGDSGVLVSTDQGVTWQRDQGPSNAFISSIFYSANGITIAGMANDSNGALYDGGLWEEAWAQSSVAESSHVNSGNNISVFPNPASGELQIVGGQCGTVHLFDLMGRERLNAVLDGANAKVDVSSLEPGIYFLRLGNHSAKVVIAH